MVHKGSVQSFRVFFGILICVCEIDANFKGSLKARYKVSGWFSGYKYVPAKMMPILKEREQLYSRKTWIWGGLEPVFCAHRLSCCCTAFNSKLTIETMGHSSQFSQLKPFKSPSLYACGCDKSAFFLRGSTVTSWYFVLRNSCKSLLLFRCVRSGILHSYRRVVCIGGLASRWLGNLQGFLK